jgi:hypothetical protein
MGAIQGRHAKAKKPTAPKKTARRTPIKLRRVFEFFFQLAPELPSELDIIHSPFRLSSQLADCRPRRVGRTSTLISTRTI